MKLKISIIILFIAWSLNAFSQPTETTYLGSVIKSGYGVAQSYGPYNIGFNFAFYGNSYNQFYVNSSGLVLFGAGSTDGTEDPIPTAGAPNNFIAPLWDQLTVSSSGNIMYATVGAAPNRKLIIQGTNIGFYPAPLFMGTYLVILYEGTNKIQVQYRIIVDATDARAHGGSATIGIENSTGSDGIEYAYHNPTAINTGKAISFTPSGATYIMNPDAIYDPEVLVTNITLPEPGIPQLLSPPQDAVIGSDYTFAWSESSNAASYTLLISQFSDMGGATSYSAGSNLTFDVTGLTLGSTLYWGVFATNATGTTWCEIKRFTTSSAPPLSAVPVTYWTEQLLDKTIKLNYTGGDASAKTAIITSLPAQGQLYQYNAGARGSQITSVPAIITDANRNVIYAATGTAGNGVGNFNYKMNDAGGDSPTALITVNVSPPGVPDVLYISKGTNVEIQFDLPMANPAGKHGQFTLTVNGSPATISSAALKTGDSYTIVLTPLTPLAGTETVLVSYTQGDVAGASGGLLFSFTDQTVTLRTQTITFSQSLAKKYNESPLTLTATASSGLALTYSSSNLGVATASGNVLTFHATGSSEITARQAGNATYAPAKYINTLTVSKGDQTISFSALPVKVFGDGDFTPTATSSSTLPVAFTSDNAAVATIVGSNIHITGGGTAIITAIQTGNALWNAATPVPQTLTVDKANQTMSFSALANRTYGDSDFTVTAVAGSALLVAFASDNPAVATVTGNTVHIVGAGTTIITASQAGNANYYAAADVPQTLTVNKADQTITFDPLLDKDFGTPDYSLFGSSGSGLPVSYVSGNTAVATVTGTTVHVVAVGTTTITASQPGDGNYNAAADVPQTLTVNTANATVTLGNLTTTYNGLPQSVTATTVPAGLTVDIVYDGSATPPVDAGTYTVGASINDGSYNGSALGTFTINKAAQTITFGVLPDKTFGDTDYTIYAVSGSGLSVSFVSGDPAIATVTGNTIHIAGTGTTTITASQGGDSNYNAAADVIQNLTVNKADQTITFDPLLDKDFGSADFSLFGSAGSGLTVSYSSSNTAVATVTGNTVHITGVGTTTITALQGGDANYNAAADVQQPLNVFMANATITLGNLTKTYNGLAEPATAVTNPAGLKVDFNYDGSATIPSDAGSYIVYASINDPGYHGTATGTLTIDKADQTITFGVLPNKIYGDSDYTVTATASSGLDVSFVSGNTAVATVTGNTIHIAGAGTTTITASQAGDGNYNAATDVPQTLTVDKATQTITFGVLPNKTFGDADYTISATASSGLGVTFVSGNTSVATVTGNTIHIVSAGTTTITASQSGGANYNAATDVQQTLTVDKATQTITFSVLPDKTYGDADFTVSATASSGLSVSFTSATPAVATVTGNTIHIAGGGTTVITAGQGGSADYLPAIQVQQTLTVNKAGQSITWGNSPEKLLIGEEFTLEAVSSSSLAVLFESTDNNIASVTGAVIKGVADGMVQIRAYNQGNQNYNSAEAFVSTEVYSTHKDIMHLFTPNNDGINDLWELPDMAAWGKCDVRVFNRWGKLVFADADYNNQWDGRSDGKGLPEGAYYFIIKSENSGMIKGTVNIVR